MTTHERPQRPRGWGIPLGLGVALMAPGCRHPPLVDPTGCSLEQVTDAGADDGNFQFHGPSPDGRRLVVGTYRGDTLGGYILDLQTRRRKPVPAAHNAGDFSPDGKFILMATRGTGGRNDIVEHALDGTSDRRLASDSAHEFLPTYSRDGTRILFNSYRTGGSDIYWMRRDGGAVERLTTNPAYEAHADLSPDGRSVVFHRRVSADDYDIILLDLATREERTVIGGPGEQAYPAWSPDGRSIAHVVPGAVPGTTDVVISTVAGVIIQRITSTPAYNAYPAFARDGRYLYLNAERGGKRNVYRVRLEGDGRCIVS